MDLIALAVPFFLLLLLIELFVDRLRRTGYYRSNDAINSISAGILSTTSGYFTKFLQFIVWGFVLSELALFEIPRANFNASPSGIAWWLLAALAWDLCYYWNHRFGHEISILWAAHSVHHQSEDYNLSTALRQSSTGFLLSWIFYVPLFLLGFPLDVLVTVGGANLIYQYWVHTQHIKRMGVLDRIFVTPSNHRVHHAQNERYIDKNYGGILILWDRLFGTFADESDEEAVVFGVRKPLQNWNPFWANLQVYDYLLFDAKNTQRWRDKIGLWFRRTGWRPADVESRFPKQRADLNTFRKFDPPLTPAVRRYVMGQFFVVILEVLLIGEWYASRGAAAVLVPSLLLWAHLLSLGMLNEARPQAVMLEWIRLLVVVPGGIMWLEYTGLNLTPAAWSIIVIYLVVSSLCLRKPL